MKMKCLHQNSNSNFPFHIQYLGLSIHKYVLHYISFLCIYVYEWVCVCMKVKNLPKAQYYENAVEADDNGKYMTIVEH